MSVIIRLLRTISRLIIEVQSNSHILDSQIKIAIDVLSRNSVVVDAKEVREPIAAKISDTLQHVPSEAIMAEAMATIRTMVVVEINKILRKKGARATLIKTDQGFDVYKY